ncbi:glycerate kinase [Halobacillus salinus]|uniref:Glycerate kinase n=1 Tax=Halobacillus salinus TaxID=192814 RepID=A0A4Z0GXC0_9BACI|nr:glycerate kinase [Halobacillus salinus]TGB02440.1 glycerate kinase [Halobacillus salinus]
MRFLLAPDSFKGSMTSAEACAALREGIHAFDASSEVQAVPIADGGEGTVDALGEILDGEKITERVRDPLGREVNASYGWIESDKLAVIEVAAASGLPLLHETELDPHQASTFGTGQLIKSALDKGAREIILGLGGSATVDAGTGCFQALGVHFFNEKKQELTMNGGALRHVDAINLADMDSRVQEVKWTIASDVTNPLLGVSGAVHVFGPQKGVQPDQLEAFERGMSRYAGALQKASGVDRREAEGSGAAGGIGFTLSSLLADASVKSGFDLIAELGKLEEVVASSDFVLTGEGKFDRQTLYGKGPSGVATLAKRYDVPCIAFAGKIDDEADIRTQSDVTAVLPIVDEPMTLEDAMRNGPRLLQKAVQRFLDVYIAGQYHKEVQR